jgi:hypothetical protein
MAIRDRDGNVYKLRGPNPIMRDQSKWEKDRVVFVNMKFGKTTEVVADERNPIKKFKTDYSILDVGEELNLLSNEEFDSNVAVIPQPQQLDQTDLVNNPEESPPNTLEHVPVQQITITGVDENMKRMFQRNMIEFHCAPAIREEHIDALYGDRKISTRYGKKHVFDGVIVSQSDLEIQFFSFRPIAIGSIVFPVNLDKQWWRVEEVAPKTGGYLCKGLVSDVNPDFS